MMWLYRAQDHIHSVTKRAGGNRTAALVNRFRILVDKHYHEQHPLSFYASQLGISTSHLNRLTKEYSQETASGIIQERVLLEAKRELTYTVKPVSQIGYSLGYMDPAYFTRLFTRSTGVSPSRFRRQMDHQ